MHDYINTDRPFGGTLSLFCFCKIQLIDICQSCSSIIEDGLFINPFFELVYGMIHALLIIIILPYWIYKQVMMFLWCLLIHVYLKPYISYVINYHESKLHSWCIYALPFNMWSNYALGSSIRYRIRTTIVSKLKTQPIQSDSITINIDWNDSRF